MTAEDTITRYCTLLSGLTLDRLADLEALCADDIQFKDPFNDISGLEAYRRVFEKMFADLETHSFGIVDRVGTGDRYFLRWVFHARLRSGGLPLHIEGMSEIRTDERGLVSRHVDYWDVGRDFYERLPLLGLLIAWIRRRVAA